MRIYLRPVTEEDGELIVRWRNAPNVSSHCFTKNKITVESNRQFYKEYIETGKYVQFIVERMEEEVRPSNIELTDYERKQEEEAIISYDELLKVKDKIYNITDDEETDEFIDELKNLRTDLQ